MNYINAYGLLALLLASLTLNSMEKSDLQIDQHVIETVKKQEEYIINHMYYDNDPITRLRILRTCVEFPWLPGILIKNDGGRIEGANRLRKYIVKNKIEHVIIADEVRHKPENDRSITIAKKMEGNHTDPINLAQAKDLVSITIDKKYWDLKNLNLLRTTINGEKRIALIDTELRGFVDGQDIPKIGLRILLDHNNLDSDAKAYIELALQRYIENHS